MMELMIAVAVMAILTVIAYSQLQQLRMATLPAGRGQPLEAAQYMERQFTADGNYDGGNSGLRRAGYLAQGWRDCLLQSGAQCQRRQHYPDGDPDRGDERRSLRPLLTLIGRTAGVSMASMTAAECW